MYIRALALASLASLTFFLVIMTAASAEDVKIMGLMDTNTVRTDADGTRPLTYLTGNCQQKHRRMKCHLNEIAINKPDTTLFEAKAKEVLEQATQEPQHLDSVMERHMLYLCQEHVIGTDRMDATSPSASLSPSEQELRQATRQCCAAKTVDNLRALLDLQLTMQARTCSLWVNSDDKTLRYVARSG